MGRSFVERIGDEMMLISDGELDNLHEEGWIEQSDVDKIKKLKREVGKIYVLHKSR